MLTIIILSGLTNQNLGQEIKKDTTEWSNPENINPFDENIFQTLNVELGDYIAQANMPELQKEYKKAASYYLFIIRNRCFPS